MRLPSLPFSLPARLLAGVAPLALAGACIGSAQAQAIEKIDLDGTSVNLTIPAGYCKLDRNVGRGAYELQERMNTGVNRVLVLFIECNELKRAMADPKARYTHHGSYLAPLNNGRATKIPANLSRTQALDEMSKAIPAMDPDTVQGRVNARTGAEGVSLSKVTTGLLARDTNAAYVAIAANANAPQSPARNVPPERFRGVVFITVLKGYAISGNLFAPVEPGAPFDKLLAQQKVNAAAAVKAN